MTTFVTNMHTLAEAKKVEEVMKRLPDSSEFNRPMHYAINPDNDGGNTAVAWMYVCSDGRVVCDAGYRFVEKGDQVHYVDVDEFCSIVKAMMKTKEITLNQYQAAAMTTCLPTSRNDAYMLTNLVGEVGELSSKIAKAIRKNKMYFETSNELAFMPKTTDDEAAEIMEGIKGELGDVLWQLSGLCSTMGYDLQEVAEYNLEKLAARKKAGTIDGNGDGVSGKERTK